MAKRKPRPRPSPLYPLADVKRLLDTHGHNRFTAQALEDMAKLDADLSDARTCIKSIKPSDFIETKQMDKPPHDTADIYKKPLNGHTVYIKLCILSAHGSETLKIISFHKDNPS